MLRCVIASSTLCRQLTAALVRLERLVTAGHAKQEIYLSQSVGLSILSVVSRSPVSVTMSAAVLLYDQP